MEQEVRLIDANKLKQHYAWWEGGSREMTMDEAKRDFDTIIDVQPTADAVEVVRCKDCKYYVNCRLKKDHTKDKRYKPNWCEWHGGFQSENGYCSWGERRTDAQTD